MPAIIPSNITVPFEECSEPAPPGGGVDRDRGFTDTKILRCAWGNRLTLASELLGGAQTLSGGGSGFRLPAAHPDFPLAYAKSVRFVPHGTPNPNAGSGYMAYSHCLLYVTYEVSDQFGGDQDDSTPFLRERFAAYTESLNLPGQYFWNAVSGGVQENPLPQAAGPVHQIRGLTWQLSWLQLTSLPVAFLNLIGNTNSAAITSRRFGVTFAEQTLLYGDPVVEATFNTDGTYALKATLDLKYKPSGWNKFFGKPGDETTANSIYAQGSASPLEIIPTASFSPLYNLS